MKKKLSEKKNSLLEVKNLTVEVIGSERKIPIIQNISFEIFKGEIFSLVGESGCGKSITSLALTKLLPLKNFNYASGEIILNGKNILNFSESELLDLRGKDISYIFQDPFASLNPLKKIKEQLIEGYLLHISKNVKEAIEKVEFLLNKIGITDLKNRLDSYPNQLSGGMLQRICIAMALMCDPKLLIADEPTSALDVTIQAQLIDLLLKIQSENQMSILFISHDLPLISNVADRIAVMYAGNIVEMGDIDKIVNSPNHPYSQALLNTIPSAKNQKKKLATIDGIVPSPKDYPIGCHFYDRCSKHFDKCKLSKPMLYKINSNQSAACFLKEK